MPATLQRFLGYGALVLLTLLGLFALDAATAPVPPARTPAKTAPFAPRAHDGGPRAFVLMLDSLRYQTATDVALMPALVGLRASAVSARVTPSRDAVTVPSLRAAFTGRERTSLLGFVANFLKRRAGAESLFDELGRYGGRALVFSDAAFEQFHGPSVELRENGGDGPTEVRDQSAMLAPALQAYASRRHDLVVLHVTYTDHVAHEVGINDPLYRERFRRADELVARAAAAVAPEDTLLVMGDHGHDEHGRHALGLDVPTFALYRGASYARGLDLGTIAIRDHRYLLGFGLGLPLSPNYEGRRHPEALRASGPLSRDYAAPSQPGPSLDARGGVPPEHRAPYAGLVLALCAACVLFARALGVGRERRSALGAIAALALAAFALGRALPWLRPRIHEPSYGQLTLVWLALWAAAAALARTPSRLRAAWALVVLPLFAFFPTVYRYGAPAALGPSWLGFTLCAVIAFRSHSPRPADGDSKQRTRERMAALGLLVLLLFPFAAADSSNFQFVEWVLWPTAGFATGFLWLALVAKLVLFVRPSRGLRALPFSLLACAALGTAEQAVLPRPAQLALGLALLGYAGLSRLRAPQPAATPLRAHTRELATVAGLLLLQLASVRAPVDAFYWQDCLLAALVVSGTLARSLCAPSERPVAHALLLLLAFFAAGWVGFGWTVHRLEWAFLYDSLHAGFVERHVGLLLPLILVRYALPLFAARALLRPLLGPLLPAGHRLAARLSAAKVLSLLLLTTGIGYSDAVSDVYLEAAQETAVALVLASGVWL